MSGNQPSSRPSSRVSMFSEDRYTSEDGRTPIIDQQDSRMQHLAVKAGEWNEHGVREGIYTASLIYMEQRGNDSSGSKLNSQETAKQECGEAIGEAARAK